MKAVVGGHAEEFVALSQRLKSVFEELNSTLDYYQDEDSFTADYTQFMKDTDRTAPEDLCVAVSDFILPLYSLYIVVATHGGFSAVSVSC